MQIFVQVWSRFLVLALLGKLALGAAPEDAAETPFQFGFARVGITPTEPVRLSGYSHRNYNYDGIDEALYVRVMALQPRGGAPHVLASVDTIGFPGVLTREIHDSIESKHGIPRANFVLACTHSHAVPHIARGLDNLYAVPQSDDERARTAAYTEFVRDCVVRAVAEALSDFAPGRLFTAEGAVHFAANRRVITDGKWTGFGINLAGPVDHALPVLKITDESGTQLRGVVFNYACHCTTFGDYNRVNGDWAGYAAKYLEQKYDQQTGRAYALCTIGCGADANPERVPERALAIAQAQGREVADEVSRLIEGPMREITAPMHATYGFAGLPIDRPSPSELEARLNDPSPQVRRHAETMLKTYELRRRLPETYPMPVQVWRFGHEYSMIFLGGEVVAEYALRIKRELAAEGAVGVPWVTAYANDVFGYVASERMRDEGGYEVDFSMIYYLLPGRWSSGTEEVIMRRVHELYADNLPQSPLTPEASLPTFTLPPEMEIGIVAAEPLIADPVHFTVGPDGRLWVVDMSDYPNGAGDAGAGPGRIRVLTDVDHDGRYDEAVTFLDRLVFPTGVMPWRKGALISGAPDIIYAEDTDGDGHADRQEKLFSGFKEANPQHRVNGFCVGLDNWLYLAGGDSGGDITCMRTGVTVNVSGRDSRIDPDRNIIEAATGRSQFGRTRDNWGNWFGNENSAPLVHYVLPDRYLGRNPYVPVAMTSVTLYDQPAPPAVYPTSRTVDRFNDLFAENRFTSACSPHIFRDTSLGDDVYGAALICEPVHNLVSRTMLERDGISFKWSRHPREQESEFLSSSDNWFRPTQLMTGPDGALWVADMYRMVIEHPEWIPDAWQAQLNLYAGNNRGRIYRVFKKPGAGQSRAFEIPDLTKLDDFGLVALLSNSNGWHRDTAQMLLVQQASQLSREALNVLERAAAGNQTALAQVHALNILEGRRMLPANVLCAALASSVPQVVCEAVRLAESHFGEAGVLQGVTSLAEHENAAVRLQVALSLGETTDPSAVAALMSMAERREGDRWLQTAILSSATGKADAILAAVLGASNGGKPDMALIPHLVATELADHPVTGLANLLDSLAPQNDAAVADWQLLALAACLDALERDGVDCVELMQAKDTTALVDRIEPLFAAAREAVNDTDTLLERRISATRLLGRGPDHQDDDRAALALWLSPQHHPELQSAAISALSRLQANDVPALLLKQWTSAAPQLRARIMGTLLSRETWTQSLIQVLADGELAAADLDAVTRERLNGHSNEGIRTRAIELLDAPTSTDREQVIAGFQNVHHLAGDPERGRTVFQNRCAACHQLHGIGSDIGAQLSALTNKSTEDLLTAILDPNRAVEFKYLSYNLLTTGGRVLSGLIVDENATTLTIAQSDGTRESVLRSEIETLVATQKSFMPEGLEKDVSAQDLADVISFVQSPMPTSE